MKNIKALLLVISSILFIGSLSAANRYWIATTTANWNSTLNWSTTSGGAGGASVPGSGDVAIFNAAKVGSCTINANVNVLGFSVVSGYTGTISKGTFTMTVGTTGYIQAAGTFSGGSGTMSAILFTLSAGTFTSTSGNFTVGTPAGNATIFTHSGGTFNHNNGTVTFGANTSTAVYTVDVITGTLFYNVVANLGTGLGTYNSTIQTAGTDTVKAANNLTHSSAVIKGYWRTQGNLIVSTAANGGTGNIIMFGTGNKTYSYSAGRTCNVVINKSSGTVGQAMGTIDLSVQGFKLLAGTFTAPSANFYIGGTLAANATVFDHTAGTYTHNSGTTVFDMNGSFTFTIKTLNTTVLNHTTINSKGTQVLQNATDTLRVNNLTLTQGAFNTGLIQVKGNVIVTNTFGGTGKIAFMGTVDQNFTLTGATDKFNVTNLIIKQSPGKNVVLQSAAILDQSGQSLTLTRGNIISTSTNLLTLGNGVTVSGMSNSSYVIGPMKKIGNAAFTFPVGKNGHYRRIAISAPSVTTDAYTAEYFEQNSNNTYSHSSKDGSLAQLSTNEYWNLARTTGTSNVSVTLSWDTTVTSCSFANASNLRVASWNGTTWKDKGNGGTTGNLAAGTVISNGVSNTFGAYTLATTSTFNCRNLDFTWTPSPVHAGNIISFDNTSQRFGSNFVYEWNFERGNHVPVSIFESATRIDTSLLNDILTIVYTESDTVEIKIVAINEYGARVDSLIKTLAVHPVEFSCICPLNEDCEIVRNGSFDLYQDPPNTVSQIYELYCWNKTPDNSILGCNDLREECNHSIGTSDFYNENALPPTGGWDMNVPNITTNIAPLNDPIITNEGSYAAIFTYGNNYTSNFHPEFSDHYREYIFQKFESPLEVGKMYKFKAKVRLSDMAAIATGVGVMFSNNYVCTNNITSASITPNQLIEKTPASLPGLTSSTQWTDFTVCFTAENNWEWMTFGNFKNDDIGNFVHLNNTIFAGDFPELWQSQGYHAYYFLDEFSLKPFAGGAGEDRDLACGFSTLLGDDVCGSETVTYSWSPGTGLSCTTCPRPTATITSSQTYTLTVTDVETGCQLTDQVTVTVVPCCEGHNYQTAVDYTIVPGYGDHSEDWGAGIGAAGWNISNPTQSGYNRLAINNTFTVDANDNFTFSDIQILMGSDAKIIIESGATLTIDHCWLHACQRMWECIFVKPGGKLIINGGSLIEDAKTAVVTLFPINDALDISQSIFNKNYISVVIAASGAGINPATIVDNYFLCQTTLSLLGAPNYSLNLLDPHTQETRSYADIVTWRVNDITIGGATDRNFFDNGYYGIYSMMSNVESINNKFTNFRPPSWCSDFLCSYAHGKCIYATTEKDESHTLEVTGDNEFYDSNWGVHTFNNMNLDVDGNEFHDLVYGVAAHQSVMENRNITVSNNIMDDMWIGVWCMDNKSANMDITTNTIDINETLYPNFGTGIAVLENTALVPTSVLIDNNDITDAQTGARTFNTNQNNIISNNDVTVLDNSGGLFTGILSENTTWSFIYNNYVESGSLDLWKSGIRAGLGAFNLVYCNTAINIGVGLHFTGAMQPSFVFKNKMESDNRGLVLNGVVGNIGWPATPNNIAFDNTWVGSYTSGNPEILSTDFNNTTKRTYYRNVDPLGIYTPSNSLGAPPIFAMLTASTPTNIGSFNLCPGGPDGAGTDDIVTPADEKNAVLTALSDNSIHSYYTSELKWSTKMGIYVRLIEDATLRNSHTTITNFHDSCFVANIGKLMRVNNAFEDAETNFAGGIGQDYLDTLNSMTTSIIPEDALRDVLKIALEKHLDNTTVIDSLSYDLTVTFEELFPDSTFDAGEYKDRTYGSSELNVLQSIAAECPFEYGPAVYMARVMLSQNDTIPYPYHHECEMYGAGSGKWDEEYPETFQEDNKRSIKIYPNPANNLLSIELMLEEEEQARIELWSISGTFVQSTMLKSGKTDMDVNNLNSGIYFYTIFINDLKQQSGKQIIMK